MAYAFDDRRNSCQSPVFFGCCNFVAAVMVFWRLVLGKGAPVNGRNNSLVVSLGHLVGKFAISVFSPEAHTRTLVALPFPKVFVLLSPRFGECVGVLVTLPATRTPAMDHRRQARR